MEVIKCMKAGAWHNQETLCLLSWCWLPLVVLTLQLVGACLAYLMDFVWFCLLKSPFTVSILWSWIACSVLSSCMSEQNLHHSPCVSPRQCRKVLLMGVMFCRWGRCVLLLHTPSWQNDKPQVCVSSVEPLLHFPIAVKTEWWKKAGRLQSILLYIIFSSQLSLFLSWSLLHFIFTCHLADRASLALKCSR